MTGAGLSLTARGRTHIASAQPRMDFDTDSALLRGAIDSFVPGAVICREESLTAPSVEMDQFARTLLSEKLPVRAQAIKVQAR